MKIDGPGPIPADVLSFFRGKLNVPEFDWRDVWREEHAHAFTVAKATQVDVLVTIRTALDEAIAEGLTLRQFAGDLTPQLQRMGWWGKGLRRDPATGEMKKVQLGSPRRLRTIYRANMRTARSAGQWVRAQRTKTALPYFIYELGPSKEHREDHAAWAGTLLPIDHPWWTTHMPPNGWGCKCRVRQVSQREADRLIAAGRVKTVAPKIRRVPWENKRTGKVEMVPEGIDPGWDTNPGKVRQEGLDKMLSGKLEGLDEATKYAAMQDVEYYNRKKVEKQK